MWIARSRLPFSAALTLASLAACGGGGGGGGGGSGDDSPASTQRLTLSKSAVDISYPVTLGTQPEERIGISLENPGSGNYYVRARTTVNGLLRVSSVSTALGLDLVLQFRTPVDLRPGVYDDTVLLEICSDAACSSLVPGLSASLPTRYTVTAVNLVATLGTRSADLRAFVTDPSFPGMSEPDLFLEGAVFTPFIEITSTHNAVVSVSVLRGADDNNYKLRYGLEAPGTLGPGVFEDTITVKACLDRNCVNPFPESPLTLPVRLTVEDRVNGPNGYTVRITDTFGAAMAWDSTRQRIYLSSPDRSGADRVHNIVAFDPAVAQVSAIAPVTSRPNALAISGDGAFLYVAPAYTEGQLERLRLPELVADLSTPLIDFRGGSCRASDIAVAPSQPTVVALGCHLLVGGPSTTVVVILDGTTLRGTVDGVVPQGGIDADPHYVAWGADAGRVFASNVRGQTLYGISVGVAGVSVVDTASAPTLGRLRFAAGLLYADNGSIFDAGTLDRVATLVPQREGTNGVPLRVIVAAAQNRIFAIARFPDLPHIHFAEPKSLVSFDLAQRTQIASIPLDPTLVYEDLLRFGDDGLALLGYDRLILVNGTFVAP